MGACRRAHDRGLWLVGAFYSSHKDTKVTKMWTGFFGEIKNSKGIFFDG